MSKHYEPDPYGLAEIAKSAQMGAAMVAIAKAGVAGAQSISPVVSGEYRDSFEVRPAVFRAGWRNEDRSGAQIVNTAPYASAVERRHKILSKVASIIGGG